MIFCENLYKAFGDNHVLQGVDLHIKRGESMVIIGGSGTGKSVLIKHIIGLLSPDAGRVTVDGQVVGDLHEDELNEMRKKFGMLFQGAALFDSLTVGGNVGFALKEHTDLAQSKIDERVKECLEMVGMKDVERLMPAELSGGMKKRVGLARAIAMNPQIILFDEPTTGLDPVMADVINDLIIKTTRALKVTSVTITHDMVSANRIADRIAMLYQGKIVAIGTPDEVMFNQTNPAVREFVEIGRIIRQTEAVQGRHIGAQ
ncbi:MAG: ABC transporter ATP-binding protein [Nitrospinae bacterium]|nr:ABC transporter ATP-binding protein [Nitrospinota bacterium]